MEAELKVVVVANGEPAAGDVQELIDAQLVIAADGGARWLEAVGRRPDLIVGDLDSLDPGLLGRLEAAGVEIERHPSAKEASDAELALARAAAAGADEVVLLGAFGGLRIDHALANLLLVADLGHPGRTVCLVHGRTRVRALRGGERLKLAAGIGDLVTLLPVGGDAEGVTTEGLRFELNGETLRFGSSRGLSNVITAASAAVALGRGTLLVVEIGKGVDS